MSFTQTIYAHPWCCENLMKRCTTDISKFQCVICGREIELQFFSYEAPFNEGWTYEPKEKKKEK